MRYALPLLFAVLLLPAVGKAETQCPWINKATAAGSQDVSIQLEVQTLAASSSCLFRYDENGTAYQLQITVRDAAKKPAPVARYESQCVSKMAHLNGIGNEAVMCRVKSGSSLMEQVVGRVRDRVFVVHASADSMKNEAITKRTVRNRAQIAAEQVAGNLF